jgi:hypothetical protein
MYEEKKKKIYEYVWCKNKNKVNSPVL